MLSFYFGCMGAGKTTSLIVKYNNLLQKKQCPLIIKPAKDTREGIFRGEGQISSRIIKDTVPCFYFSDLKRELPKLSYGILLLDEAQFLTKEEVNFLINYNTIYKKDIIVYGLKTDINGDVFEGASVFLALADNIYEIETLCQAPGCMNKAVVHARYIDGVRDLSTNSFAIENEKVTYKSLCFEHWKSKKS